MKTVVNSKFFIRPFVERRDGGDHSSAALAVVDVGATYVVVIKLIPGYCCLIQVLPCAPV